MVTWNDIRHFESKEFDSPDAPNTGLLMNMDFIRLLEQLRVLVGRPLPITSGFRTAKHHAEIYKNKSSIPNSAHLRGLAADIRVLDSSLRYLLIKNALALGFTRLETAPTHVHLDMDDSLPQNILLHLGDL